MKPFLALVAILALLAMHDLCVAQDAKETKKTNQLASPALYGPHIEEWVESLAYPRPVTGPLRTETSRVGRELVKDRACFRVAEYCGSIYSHRDKLTCCNDGEDASEFGGFHSTPLSVGVCTIYGGVVQPIQISQNLWVYDSFQASCRLNNIDTCGPIECEDLELQAQGLFYFALVATSQAPYQPTEKCPTNFKTSKLMDEVHEEVLKFTNFSSSFRSGIPVEEKTGDQIRVEQNTVFIGPVFHYNGPMRIVSRTHNTLYKEGWFSATVPLTGFNEYPVESLPTLLPFTLPKVESSQFWTYNLDFFRPSEEYKMNMQA